MRHGRYGGIGGMVPGKCGFSVKGIRLEYASVAAATRRIDL
jgi:hypothetical protein